ncbi:MAG: MmcQ/YjbR family DNA-binding protein [Asticcacaulis sp.]
MVTLEQIRQIVGRLPDTEEGTSWGSPSFKVNKKAILYWNVQLDCPVFKVSFEERDFLLEVDPDCFFTTDHHRPWPLIIGRPEKLDIDWVRENIERVWRAQALKTTLKRFDSVKQ